MRINNFNKLLLSFFSFSLFFVSNLYSQKDDIELEESEVRIYGDIAPKVGDIVTYSAIAVEGPKVLGCSWFFNPESQLTIISKTEKTVKVKFNKEGAFTVKCVGKNISKVYFSATISVAVSSVSSPPDTPSAPIISSQSSSSAILERGTPPSGVTWYWQGTNASGISMSNSSKNYTVPSSGVYYLRAKNDSGWSSNSSSVEVNLLGSEPEPPGTPSAPVIVSEDCASVILKKQASPSGITWYWQGTNPNGTSMSNSSDQYTVSVSGRYYLRAKGNAPVVYRSSLAAKGGYSGWSSGSSYIDVVVGATGGSTWYRDADGDGYGTPNTTKTSCTKPSGYVSNADDCDDSRYFVNVNKTWYRDADGDGRGDLLNKKLNCTQPVGYSANSLDCNDNDASIYNATWYRDTDGDGYGDASKSKENCGKPIGYVDNDYDCDDTNKLIGITVWYRDADGDGFGDKLRTIASCTKPDGYVANNDDLDDNDENITINNKKTYYRDADQDGYGSNLDSLYVTTQPDGYIERNGDCDDSDSSLNPETKWYEDIDGNGYGDPNSVIQSCDKPDGYARRFLGFRPCPSSESSYSLVDENYVFTRVYQDSLKNPVAIKKGDVIESIVYYDGLGRAKQSIGIGQSPMGKDIITHMEYDGLGRMAKEYLPYVSSSCNNGVLDGSAKKNTLTYYQTNYSEDFNNITDINSINPYSEKQFDGSPLNRVMKQAAPGHSWRLGAGHEIKFDYQTNTSNEVKAYYVTTVLSDNVYVPTLQLNESINNGNYLAGELYKTVTKDENWKPSKGKDHTTEEFKNKQGQVILKRTYASVRKKSIAHDTYYIYDDYGNLTYVLTPKARAHLKKPNGVELSELCYQYKYDYRNRLVEKKIPGKGLEYVVYDKLDRPVLTQDANQRSNNKNNWLFTKYDVLGRVIYTGIYMHDSSISQYQMQSYFDNQNSTKKLYEDKLTNAGAQGSYYSNNNFPDSNIELLTINYYDNYTFNRAGTGISVNSYGINSTNRLQGLSTGSRIKVLGGNNKWITTVTYYDKKARPIYVYTKNDFLSSTDIVKSNLDFSGRIEETTLIHDKADDTLPAITTIDKFEYDHMGRLKKQTQTIGNKTEVIVINQYDELGQLKRKDIGGDIDNQNRLQNVDYNYNVRGWLTKVNDPDKVLKDDLFAFELNYDKITRRPSGASSLFTKPLYNGNISETTWRSINDNQRRGYGYNYDALNRLKTARYRRGEKLNQDNWFYDTRILRYDLNGNIRRVKRNSKIDGVATRSDDLFYYYGRKSNKLVSVRDNHPDVNAGGFKDGSKSRKEYFYDANGNMLKDLNKGITSIEYNHLNLPTKVIIKGKPIQYTYDATGVKLRKTVEGVTTDYSGNYIYKKISSGIYKLEFFNHPEGYVKNDNGVFNYVYQYKDHLGNVRLSYTDANNDGVIQTDGVNSEIIEESNYYPFGLKHKGYNNVVSPLGNSTAEKFGYNGKELEESLGLNLQEMDFRMYDPALGRFNVVDPLAEERNWLSPYNFVQNNPILRIDPTGLLDDYGIDQNGKVELIKKTDDATDTLYSVTRNEDGELVKDGNGEVVKNDTNGDGQVADGDFVTVEKGLLNNIENTTYTESDGTKHNLQIMDVSKGSFKDIKSIFEFSANNSNNEFSYQSFANGNKFISTTFLPSAELSATTLVRRNGKLLHHVHSHPGQDYFAPSPGDISSASYLIKKYGTRLEMYSPLLGTYKDYTGESSSFELDEIIITPKKKN